MSSTKKIVLYLMNLAACCFIMYLIYYKIYHEEHEDSLNLDSVMTNGQQPELNIHTPMDKISFNRGSNAETNR